LDEELATYYIRKGEPVVIRNARKDVHTLYHEEAKAEGIGSILGVPIIFEDEIIGILRLLTEDIRSFTEVDINFAMAVAEQGGVAIQRALDYSKLR
jgi:GAF domain-containing protein